jgi:hypothetical protein
MTTLHIEHAITDFSTWQSAFDRFEEMRQQAGVRRQTVRRPVDDDQYVVIDLEFDTAEQATALLGVLNDKIWAARDNSPALAGKPRTSILETV